MEEGNKRFAIECKASLAPSLSIGFWNSLEDLQIDQAWVIVPMEDESYPIRENVRVTSLREFLKADL